MPLEAARCQVLALGQELGDPDQAEPLDVRVLEQDAPASVILFSVFRTYTPLTNNHACGTRMCLAMTHMVEKLDVADCTWL